VDTTVKDPLVGRVLDGRYRVGSRLARGGMATVYEAHDSRLDRVVALKVMHPSLADDDEFVSRFIREAHSAARLSHPNVVAVYDQGADQGHVFLVMELVRGRTLRDLVREHGHLSPRQALEVLEPVLAALGAAHQAGIIHRDVKPENVLISDDGRIKVADFGLARAVTGHTSHTTASGVLMGTVAYLSPEQVERGVADPRSDVYAAGILLYEMLTGLKPYDGETAIQVAYRHVHDDVPPPSQLVPSTPAELDALVAHATNRDPDQRPADARRMLAEVSSTRRLLSDGELDTLGPALDAIPTQATDKTMVVDLREDRAAAPRRGDTGPLGAPGNTGPVPRRRSRGPLALALVVALALVLSGLVWLYVAVLSQTTTPGLIGQTKAAAAAKAEKDGLDVSVKDREYSETIAKGRVISTDPDPGDSIDKGGTVGLVMSLGPERYAVPNVEGVQEERARAMLEDRNLAVASPERRYSSKVERGAVISTDPKVGTMVKPGTAISLVISNGVQPVAVPDVVELQLEEAQAQPAEAKLRYNVTEKFDDAVPEGVVMRQSPEAPTTAPKNSVVQLVVSKGPREIDVPDVVGQPVASAQPAIEAAGFVVNVNQLPGGPGIVLEQSSSKAPKGATITLYVF
jgi:eukaryotic-like serine/threonine-protein kinase